MNHYKITMTKEFLIKADDEKQAINKAIERCADDVETLMPHNMEIRTERNETLPASFFE